MKKFKMLSATNFAWHFKGKLQWPTLEGHLKQYDKSLHCLLFCKHILDKSQSNQMDWLNF